MERKQVNSYLLDDKNTPLNIIPRGSTALTGTGIVTLSKPSTLYIGTSGTLACWLVDDDVMTTVRLYKNAYRDFPRLVKAIDMDNTTAADIIQDL